ncbi:unnamed protein product, partial [Mesorhabditis spiculigera]
MLLILAVLLPVLSAAPNGAIPTNTDLGNGVSPQRNDPGHIDDPTKLNLDIGNGVAPGHFPTPIGSGKPSIFVKRNSRRAYGSSMNNNYYYEPSYRNYNTNGYGSYGSYGSNPYAYRGYDSARYNNYAYTNYDQVNDGYYDIGHGAFPSNHHYDPIDPNGEPQNYFYNPYMNEFYRAF